MPVYKKKDQTQVMDHLLWAELAMVAVVAEVGRFVYKIALGLMRLLSPSLRDLRGEEQGKEHKQRNRRPKPKAVLSQKAWL